MLDRRFIKPYNFSRGTKGGYGFAVKISRMKSLVGGFLPIFFMVLVSPALADSGSRPIASVTDVRVWSSPRFARVVIHLDGPVSFDYNHLKLPTRLYVDIRGAKLKLQNPKINVTGDGVLKGVRVGKSASLIPRVVLDLQALKSFKVFALSAPNRVVVDVEGAPLPVSPKLAISPPARAVKFRSKPRDFSKNKAADKKSSVMLSSVSIGPPKKEGNSFVRSSKRGSATSVYSLEDMSLAERFRRGLGKIVIDPGHGGKDPGAIGRTGIFEKTIALDLSRRILQTIRRKLKTKVYLTRKRDVFIPLAKRTAFANRMKADLFLSIHANSARNPKLSGVETYLLSEATDRRAKKVAARENQVSLRELSDLQIILTDLRIRGVINRSLPLAASVNKSMFSLLSRRYAGVRNLGVKQAPFYVLLGAKMPSVLVETGFISNRRDERRLASSGYRQTLAESIVRGIQAFVERTELARQID